MAKTEQYTAQEMIEALKRTRGMPTVAARYLGCHYTTVKRYIDNYPTVKAAVEELRQNLGEQVDTTLASLALGKMEVDKDGKSTGVYAREPNITALIFLAKTRFKDRGYTEKIEFAGTIDISLVGQTIKALEEAGLDATEFFQKALARAEQKRNGNS